MTAYNARANAKGCYDLAIAEKRKELGMTRTDEELYAEDMADMAGWDVDALIAALKSAPAGSRELDIAIHKSLGWVAAPVGWWNEDGTTYGYREVPQYSRSLDAALTLVPEGWFTDVACEDHNGRGWSWGLTARHGGCIGSEWRPTAALALTIAALKARQP